jgi:hypothetical protein
MENSFRYSLGITDGELFCQLTDRSMIALAPRQTEPSCKRRLNPNRIASLREMPRSAE